VSKKVTKSAPTLEEAFGKLTNGEKRTELAKDITVEDVYGFIQNNERKRISKFVYERFYRRYLMPFEKVDKDFNSGFAQMAACCLMIEAMQSFRNGWKSTYRLKDANGKEIPGGKIFGDFFKHYSEFVDFENLGFEFYDSIRCGILHQAETKNGWIVMRDGPLFDEPTRTINSTIFRRQMEKCLDKYCKELQADDIVWDDFKEKMAYVIVNCHGDEMKS